MRDDPRAKTLLLLRSDRRDPRAVDELVPVVYTELRDMAARQIGREVGGGTLQPTSLVHEVYLRLVDDTRVDAGGRTYFFGAAARAMRQVLIESARARGAKKRGGDRQRVALGSEVAIDDGSDIDILALDEALTELARLDERQAHVVELRFFGGLGVEEVASFLGVSERTVKTDWRVARAWLRRRLAAPDERGS